jgi:RNA polymerase sigma factor (sigma-70 family)
VSNQQHERLLEGLRKREHKILSEIYSQYYPVVLRYIMRNSGNESDAKDVFQESLIVIYKLAEEKSFAIKEDFGAFIMGISKRIWLKQIRSNSIHERYVNQSEQTEVEEHISDEELESEHKLALIRRHIVNLGEDCRKVLMWSAEGIKNEDIAKKLGYKSEKVIRSKKYKCKEALLKLIKQDPDFRD